MALKAKVYAPDGSEVGELVLPGVFETPLRPDVIRRAFLAVQSLSFQPQGRDLMAGKRSSAKYKSRRRSPSERYVGLARLPREAGTMRARIAPMTVKGRLAHPPLAWKKVVKKIPRKEKKLAMRSAIAATADRDVVARRGHVVDEVPSLPLVASDEVQAIARTGEAVELFMNLGLWPDVLRAKESKKVRAGKGKMRGRRYKMAVGPLVVVGEDEGIIRAVRNLPGVDAVLARNLNIMLLAPGAHPGRLTLWTESAIEVVDELWGRDG
ncbi:50S ribosomal protein L4 [Candidatus Bathyarchaeota archaeon]|nr:MAG: 50S ribosomal protein L4 [Candidatus Bathyarchaeota archaeon]